MFPPRRFLALTAAVLLASGAASSSVAAGPASPVGVWMTGDNHGLVEVYACGARLCGKILTSDQLKADPTLKDTENKDPALRGRPLKGLVFMTGFAGGPPRWTGGSLYRPSNGSLYQGSIEMTDANTLKLKGCIVAPLCANPVWTRAR